MAKPLTLAIGTQNLVVDPDTITLKKVKELARAVTEVRVKHSALTKYPRINIDVKDEKGNVTENRLETMEEYETRVKKELQESNTRVEDESEKDFVKRLQESGDDNQSFLFDQLKAIAQVFGQEDKVTEDAYDMVPYTHAKKMVKDVLDICDLG